LDIRKESIKNLYQGNQESRGLEFKRGFEWTHPTAKSLEIIKTVLCMYNTPEGGDLIIGIKENQNDSRVKYTGINIEELASFEKNEETIKAMVNSYSYMIIEPVFEIVEDSTFETQKDFLIIRVPHYKEYPTIAKRDGKYLGNKGEEYYKFRKNDLLTRSKSPKYSNCKAGQEELNEMIELGAKGVRSKCKDILNLETREKNFVIKNYAQKYQKERSEIYGKNL
jgi:hypothetical protein